MSLMDTAPAPRYFDEQSWVEKLKKGDELAWEILVARHAPDLRRAIQQQLHSNGLPLDLLDDVEGETWRTAIRKMADFTWMGDDKLRNWLSSIAHHHIQTFARVDRKYLPSMEDVEGRNLENEFALDLFLFSNGLVDMSAEDCVLLAERLAELDSALQALSLRDREIFLASLLDNVDRAELAERYEIEEDSVSQILWRCKNRLRGLLKQRSHDEETVIDETRRRYG
ncbi:MAG: sigma-70 family RNA polymerase sigma factor [Chloroflexota bacterium]|nr:sigma-70 family RNA polymerase sigma factor [Chloroflexota bacterium]